MIHPTFPIAVVLGIVVAQAQPLPTVKAVTEHMQRRYEMIDDITAAFDQSVHLGYADITQAFKGSVVFKKPNRYRIETEHQTLVTDGATVWVYSPANAQVIVDKYKEQRNSVSPEQFLLTLPTSYFATVLSRESLAEGPAIVLKLVPKDDRSFVRTVKLWLLESRWEVRRIQIVDQNETETSYAITAVRLNTNVKDSVFEFTAPQGAEVVDLR